MLRSRQHCFLSSCCRRTKCIHQESWLVLSASTSTVIRGKGSGERSLLTSPSPTTRTATAFASGALCMPPTDLPHNNSRVPTHGYRLYNSQQRYGGRLSTMCFGDISSDPRPRGLELEANARCLSISPKSGWHNGRSIPCRGGPVRQPQLPQRRHIHIASNVTSFRRQRRDLLKDAAESAFVGGV